MFEKRRWISRCIAAILFSGLICDVANAVVHRPGSSGSSHHSNAQAPEPATDSNLPAAGQSAVAEGLLGRGALATWAVQRDPDALVLHKCAQYFDVYERWLPLGLTPQIREAMHPVSVLEIGVQAGGGLELLRHFTPSGSVVVGLDLQSSVQLLQDRLGLHAIVADATDRAQIASALGPQGSVPPMVRERGFDAVLDDGSHTSRDILETLRQTWPMLRPGGTYLIEDLQVNTWEAVSADGPSLEDIQASKQLLLNRLVKPLLFAQNYRWLGGREPWVDVNDVPKVPGNLLSRAFGLDGVANRAKPLTDAEVEAARAAEVTGSHPCDGGQQARSSEACRVALGPGRISAGLEHLLEEVVEVSVSDSIIVLRKGKAAAFHPPEHYGEDGYLLREHAVRQGQSWSGAEHPREELATNKYGGTQPQSVGGAACGPDRFRWLMRPCAEAMAMVQRMREQGLKTPKLTRAAAGLLAGPRDLGEDACLLDYDGFDRAEIPHGDRYCRLHPGVAGAAPAS